MYKERLNLQLQSSIAKGHGYSGREFREQVLALEVADLPPFAPYTHIRIRQNYQYEQGLLEEVVELFSIKNGKEIPFMKNHETAWFYTKGKLDGAPGSI